MSVLDANMTARYAFELRKSIAMTGYPLGGSKNWFNIPPAEAEQRYYAMLEQPAMAA